MADYWITLNVSGTEDDARRVSDAIAKVVASEKRPGVSVTSPTIGANWLTLSDAEVATLQTPATNKTIIAPPRGF
jgi:hypothetical protein